MSARHLCCQNNEDFYFNIVLRKPRESGAQQNKNNTKPNAEQQNPPGRKQLGVVYAPMNDSIYSSFISPTHFVSFFDLCFALPAFLFSCWIDRRSKIVNIVAELEKNKNTHDTTHVIS